MLARGLPLLLLGLVVGLAGRFSPEVQQPTISAAAAAEGPLLSATWIPALGPGLDDERCYGSLHIQHRGLGPARPLLAIWSVDSKACAPTEILCGPLLATGSSWHLRSGQLKRGAESAVAITFAPTEGTAQSLASIDHLCRSLDALVDDCAAWSAWLEAISTATIEPNAGALLPQLRPADPPAVTVSRICPGGIGMEAHTGYRGLSPAALGTARESGETPPEVRWTYSVDLGETTERLPVLHLQNTGLSAANAELLVLDELGCGAARSCGTLTLPSGLAMRPNLEACLAIDGARLLQVVADAPLAIVAEGATEGESPVFGATTAWPSGDAGSQEPRPLVAPLAFDPAHGFDSTVVVRNLGAAEADLRLQLLDGAGRPIFERRATLCPGGMRQMAILADDFRSEVGTASIWLDAAQPIAAEVIVDRPRLPGRTMLRERQRYAMSPLQAGPWSIPYLARDLRSTGDSTELSLLTSAPEAGTTDVVIVLMDQNAVVDVLCRRLSPRQPVRIDPQVMGIIHDGLVGSALVSAAAWTHSLPPSLGIVSTMRKGSRFGSDIPGDEVAAVQAAPLAAAPVHLSQAASLCLGDALPSGVLVPAPADFGTEDAHTSRHLLPVLDYQESDAVCEARMQVHNEAAAAQRYVFIGWEVEDMAIPPAGGAPPMQVTCSPRVGPGDTWTLPFPRQAPSWPRSGMVFVLDADRTDRQAGGASDEPLADRVCAWVNERIAASRGVDALVAAWDSEAVLDGSPLSLAAAAGGSARIDVSRECPHNVTPGRAVTTTYGSIVAASTNADRRGMDHWHGGGLVFSDYAGFSSLLEIQNAGLRPTTITARFQYREDCLRESLCTSFAHIGPGVTTTIDLTDCVGPDYSGIVRLLSREPLAVVASHIAGDASRDVTLWPGDIPLDLNGDRTVDQADGTLIEDALGKAEGDAAWDPKLDLMPDGLIDDSDLLALAQQMCGSRAPWTPPVAEAPDRRRLFFPALSEAWAPDACTAEIQISNLSDEGLMPLWIAFPSAGLLEGCSAPTIAQCGPLLAPGGLFHMHIASDALQHSAVLFGLRDLSLAEVGLPADERRLLDVVCSATAGLSGDCAGWTALLAAADGRGTWAGVPLSAGLGGPLSASVERNCDDPNGSQATTRAQHLAPAMPGAMAPEPGRGRYRYAAPLLYSGAADFDAWLHIQNAGSTAVRPLVSISGRDDCIDVTDASLPLPGEGVLPPGASVVLPLASAIGPDFQGSALIESDEPLAVVADIGGRATLLDSTLAPVSGAAGATAHGTRLGAWLPNPARNWDTGVQVFNLSPRGPARVRVRMLDDRGVPRTVLDDWVCSEGSQTFFLPIASLRQGDGPGGGRVVVDSLPGPSGLPSQPIAAALIAFGYSGVARTTSVGGEMMSLHGLLSPRSSDGSAPANGLPDSAAWHVPGLAGASAPTERQWVAVASTAEGAGHVDVSVRAWDGEMVVSERCIRLSAGASGLVDLSADLARDFRGSALVSAVAWSSDLTHPSLSVSALRLGPPRTSSSRGRDALLLSEGRPMPADRGWMAALPSACPQGPEPTARPTERPIIFTATPPPSATPTPGTATPEPDVRRLWLPWGYVSR